MYRDDSLRHGEGTAMLVRVLAQLAGVAREYDLPVLVTRSRDDGFTAPIETAAVETIHCERTDLGPRFVAESFETLVYPIGHGQVQTTLAFWERILTARQPLYDASETGPLTPEVQHMGRTNPTYRDVLRAIENQWADYRRGLRRKQQQRFDQLFEYIRSHSDASGYLNHTEPFYPALVSIDLEQEARLDELEDRITQLEAETTDDG